MWDKPREIRGNTFFMRRLQPTPQNKIKPNPDKLKVHSNAKQFHLGEGKWCKVLAELDPGAPHSK